MLFGNAQNWKSQIGCYQMDATQGDLYLVSSLDPNTVFGRPNLFLAVDTVTGLIAGFYAGMETGEQAGPEGLTIERRGRRNTGETKRLPSKVEEDLLAEVQRLRAENAYLKNLQALVWEEERRQHKKRR